MYKTHQWAYQNHSTIFAPKCVFLHIHVKSSFHVYSKPHISNLKLHNKIFITNTAEVTNDSLFVSFGHMCTRNRYVCIITWVFPVLCTSLLLSCQRLLSTQTWDSFLDPVFPLRLTPDWKARQWLRSELAVNLLFISGLTSLFETSGLQLGTHWPTSTLVPIQAQDIAHHHMWALQMGSDVLKFSGKQTTGWHTVSYSWGKKTMYKCNSALNMWTKQHTRHVFFNKQNRNCCLPSGCKLNKTRQI